MEIEVRQPEGYFAKACIQALNEDGVTVSYAHKPSESVSYDRCRILPDKPIKNDFKSGDTIEAYYKKGAQPCEFWQKAKLRDIKVCVFTNVIQTVSILRVNLLSSKMSTIQTPRTLFSSINADRQIWRSLLSSTNSTTARSSFQKNSRVILLTRNLSKTLLRWSRNSTSSLMPTRWS